MVRKLRIVVYVTGSIANYKALTLVRKLTRRGNQVRVVMTRGATRFIRPLSFQAISGAPVVTDQSRQVSSRGILHVDLARWTDVAVVMPATADFIAKVANGIADDIASTCLLATAALKIVVPAMNSRMFSNPATQRNLGLLRRYPGFKLLGPVKGPLAEGYSGRGRMMEPEQVIQDVHRLLTPNRSLTGRKLMVTAGGTEEPLDPVRMITNRSTGKMGIAIARVASRMGAQVQLICGRITVPLPAGIPIQRVRTTEDMQRTVVSKFPHYDGLVMAAALADFKPARIAQQKIKKHAADRFSLTLQKTPDVLQRVAKLKRPHQVVVGFSAETQNLLKNANLKMRRKRLDVMVANDVADSRIGFGSDNNRVVIMQPHRHPIRTPIESKALVARRLLEVVAHCLNDN